MVKNGRQCRPGNEARSCVDCMSLIFIDVCLCSMTGYICFRGEAGPSEGYNGIVPCRSLSEYLVSMVICHIRDQGTSHRKVQGETCQSLFGP